MGSYFLPCLCCCSPHASPVPPTLILEQIQTSECLSPLTCSMFLVGPTLGCPYINYFTSFLNFFSFTQFEETEATRIKSQILCIEEMLHTLTEIKYDFQSVQRKSESKYFYKLILHNQRQTQNSNYSWVIIYYMKRLNIQCFHFYIVLLYKPISLSGGTFPSIFLYFQLIFLKSISIYLILEEPRHYLASSYIHR